ncbi:MAG: hypothetical protein OXN17_01830 [Candidatus Poribacteria bacterium]|nr:hypothetical protein [Candidatus Poribacteria bacterium]
MLSLRGAMVPTEIILSSKTYEQIVAEQEIAEEDTEESTRLILETHFSIPILIREENTDVITAKELYPDRCPICGRRIPFLREMIERLESRATNKVRCPLGHRYEGEIKMYYLNIFQMEEMREKSERIESCPICGSNDIQYLGPREVFCLDCEWDNNMLPRF